MRNARDCSFFAYCETRKDKKVKESSREEKKIFFAVFVLHSFLIACCAFLLGICLLLLRLSISTFWYCFHFILFLFFLRFFILTEKTNEMEYFTDRIYLKWKFNGMSTSRYSVWASDILKKLNIDTNRRGFYPNTFSISFDTCTFYRVEKQFAFYRPTAWILFFFVPLLFVPRQPNASWLIQTNLKKKRQNGAKISVRLIESLLTIALIELRILAYIVRRYGLKHRW